MMHGYTKVREIVHTCILPALDRCVALLTHLRGLAIYYEHSSIINVPSGLFDSIFHIIRCMRLLAHHTLLYYSEEAQQFEIFSKWLRREIDVQAAQTPPNPNDEAEQEVYIDHALLFAYIKGALQKSKLDPFVKSDDAVPPVSSSPGIYDECKKALTSWKRGEAVSDELLNMSAYFKEWTNLHAQLVALVVSHQRSGSQIVDGIILEEGEMMFSDMLMVEPEARTPAGILTTITGGVPKESPNQGESFLAINDRKYAHYKRSQLVRY